jgi:hypothetical protein
MIPCQVIWPGGSDAGAVAGAVRGPPPGKRGVFLLERLVRAARGGGVRVRSLGGTRAGEIRLTRFLRNPLVTPEKMTEAAAAATAGRCKGRDVLVIQDTTVVRSEGGGGLYMHPGLAVDAEGGAILGLVHACFLSRQDGRAADRKKRPVEDKESQRWLDVAARAADVCATARSITVVADREADIFALFARRPPNVGLVIRAAHDRSLEEGERLFAALDARPVAGRATVSVPAGPGRSARVAQVEARFMTASLKRPRNGLVENLPLALSVTLVEIRESDPPAGAVPLHWRLIATAPVSDAAEAFAVADTYRRRWVIEQLFRTLKTKGFDVEGMLVGQEAPLKNLLMATLIAAVTVQQLVHAREGEAGPGPLQPLTDAFEPEDQPILEALCRELEGKTERQKNPHPAHSLAYAAWVCARLGGWTGYYGKPGPIVMFNGWRYFQGVKHGAALLAEPRHV